MNETPKIIKAKSFSNRDIEVTFDNGVHSIINFNNYFSYDGYYSFLLDINNFLNLKIEESGDYIYWINDNGEEVEIDPLILYAILSQEKIIIDGKVVFDPALGKNAWT